jgi:MarR family transcriptional regulator, 2-MHQ and catechol-resistance regulon repressor
MTTRVKASSRERRALATYVNLLRASSSVQAHAMKHLDGHGITPSQFAVLEALYHVGPLCLSELARKILRTSGNLTMVVDNLEKSGLVRRIPNTEDRRYVRVEITENGRKVIASLFPEHAQQITKMLSRLTEAEQNHLRELCRKLGSGTSE